MDKPVIGITPLYDSEKDSFWMLPGYINGLAEAGAIPIILSITEDTEIIKHYMAICDGFLFTGGQDVSPAVYGEQTADYCGETCAMRDSFESILLDYAIRNDKAVLGICRGIQFINAKLGGTLYQDISKEYKTLTEHHMVPPYNRSVHTVAIEQNTPLYDLLKKETIGVNSYHHQAVKELSPFLSASACSEDGLIEAVYMPHKKFVWAVQWHPEFSYLSDENSKKIFSEFIKSAKS